MSSQQRVNLNHAFPTGSDWDMLNGGILLAPPVTFKPEIHLDYAHVKSLDSQFGLNEPTHLGMVSTVTDKLYNNNYSSFFDLSKPGAVETVTSTNGIFTMSIPVAVDNDVRLICFEAAYPDKPCFANTTAKMTFTKKLAEHNAILTPSLYSGVQVITTEDPIMGDDASGYTYTVKLLLNDATRSNGFIPLQYLQKGVIWIQMGSFSGERTVLYNSGYMPSVAAALNMYQNVGDGSAQRYYTVTRKAAMNDVANLAIYSLEEAQQTLEMLIFRPGSIEHREAMMLKSKGKTYEEINKYLTKKCGSKDGGISHQNVQKAWIPALEAMLARQIDVDLEAMAIFGNGGTIGTGSQNDPLKGIAPLGLFRQMMRANIYEYNIKHLTLGKVINFFLEPYRSAYGFSPGANRQITIKLGTGAWKILHPQIQEYNRGLLNGINVTINRDDFLTGDADNLMVKQTRFQSVQIDAAEATIKFEIAKEFDRDGSITDFKNNVDNPIVSLADGSIHRLSSFIITAPDLLNDADRMTIKKLVNSSAENNQLHIYNVDGKMPRYGNPSNHSSVGPQNPGYTVYMEKSYYSYLLKNPGNLFMMLPLNDVTGQHFGANYWDKGFTYTQTV